MVLAVGWVLACSDPAGGLDAPLIRGSDYRKISTDAKIVMQPIHGSCRVKCPDQIAQMSPARHEKGRTGRLPGTAGGHGPVIDQQSCPLYRPHGRGGSCWPGR